MTETLDLAKPENFSISYAKTSNTTGIRPLDVLILTAEAPPIISAIYSRVPIASDLPGVRDGRGTDRPGGSAGQSRCPA